MATTNKKKVLIFVPEFPRETFIERDVTALIERGNLDVSVVTLKKGNQELPDFVADRVSVANLGIVNLASGLAYFFSKPGAVREIFSLARKDKSKSLTSNYYLALKSLGYAKVFAKHSPAEIHAHFYSDFSTIAMYASILLEIPFSVNAHARDVFEYPHLSKEKAERAKFVSVCNQRAFEVCQGFSQRAKNVQLIYHGLDPQKLFNDISPSEKTDVPLIFMGGSRLTEKKGIEYMIEASKILKERDIKHRVLIIGSGPLQKELEKKVAKAGLEEIFEINGAGAAFSELAKYYLSADLFVLPIIQTGEGDSDGIPNTIIEAALAKLPIITTDAGSVSELIENGKTGAVVPQKDAASLARAIEILLGDESQKKQLGAAAYTKALEMFDQEKNIAQLEQLLLS